METQRIELVMISASVSDQKALIRFFKTAEQSLGGMSFIVVQPVLDRENEDHLLHLLSTCCNGLQAERVEEYTTIEASKVYLLPLHKHFVLRGNSFVHNNSIRTFSQSPVIAFWESVATYQSSAFCITMQAKLPYMEGIMAVKDAGGMLMLQGGDWNNDSEDMDFLTEVDYILPVDEMPDAIVRHKETAFQFMLEDDLGAYVTEPHSSMPSAASLAKQEELDMEKLLDPPSKKKKKKPSLRNAMRYAVSNEEYRSKIHELGELNDDLNNILQSSDVGTLFLDNDFCVRKFTNSVHQYVHISEKEVGCNIVDLSLHVDYPEIMDHLQKVRETQRSVEREVSNDHGDWFQVRIYPYRTADQAVKGFVISFIKISELQELKNRLDLLSTELQTQGLELIKAIMELREEARIKEKSAAELASKNSILESVLNSMSDGLVAIDNDGRIFMLNKMAQYITGMQLNTSVDDWLQDKDILYPMSQEPTLVQDNPFVKIMNKETVQDVEVFLRTKKQWAGVYVSTSALPLSTPTGEVNGMVIAISDITNRKISEIELRNSELTKRALLDAVPDVMFRVNRAGVFLDYIPAKKEKFVPAAAFIGNRLEDALPEEIAKGIMKTIDVVIHNGEIKTFTFEHLVEDLFHFYEVRITPINEEEVLCIVRDVTDMVAAQDAIKKSEVYYRRLIQMHPAPVVIHDREGEIVEANPHFLALLGAKKETDLIGKNIFSFVKSKERTKARNVVKRGFTDSFPEGTAVFNIVDIQEQIKQVEAVGSIITYQHKRVVQVVMREI